MIFKNELFGLARVLNNNGVPISEGPLHYRYKQVENNIGRYVGVYNIVASIDMLDCTE